MEADVDGARVFVDDREAGRTPLEGLRLPTGGHWERVEKEGHQTYRRRIYLREGHPLRLKAILPTVKPRAGRLFVETEPRGARIRILNIGPKFYQGIDLLPGDYHIEVSAAGYETRKKWIRLGQNEEKYMEMALKKKRAGKGPADGKRASGEDKRIKIGIPTPYTGAFAEAAKLIAGGEQMAVDEWNKRGGLLGKKLVILREDTRQLPSVGARKARKLYREDGVDVLVGATGSNVATAELYTAKMLKKLFIIGYAYSSALTGRDCNRYTFRVGHNSLILSSAFGYWMVENLGKTFYFIAPDNLWGSDTLEDFATGVERAGGEVVGRTYFPFESMDISSFLEPVREAGPEVLFVVAGGGDASLALTQIDRLGLNREMKIAGPSTLFNAELLATVGDAAEGVMGVTPWQPDLDRPESGKFVEDYKAKMGREPPLYALGGYEAVDLYARAVKKAGTTDVEKVIDTLRGFTYDGPQGVIYIRPEDHQAMMDVYITRVENGEVKIVDRVARESYRVPVTCKKDLSRPDE